MNKHRRVREREKGNERVGKNIYKGGGAHILSPSTITSGEMRQTETERARGTGDAETERRTRGCDCVIMTNSGNAPQLGVDERREKEETGEGRGNR